MIQKRKTNKNRKMKKNNTSKKVQVKEMETPILILKEMEEIKQMNQVKEEMQENLVVMDLENQMVKDQEIVLQILKEVMHQLMEETQQLKEKVTHQQEEKALLLKEVMHQRKIFSLEEKMNKLGKMDLMIQAQILKVLQLKVMLQLGTVLLEKMHLRVRLLVEI